MMTAGSKKSRQSQNTSILNMTTTRKVAAVNDIPTAVQRQGTEDNEKFDPTKDIFIIKLCLMNARL